MKPKQIVIHCQPSMLELIEENELDWSYSPRFGFDEIDVIVNDYEDRDDEDLVAWCDLDYNQVNCIELA